MLFIYYLKIYTVYLSILFTHDISFQFLISLTATEWLKDTNMKPKFGSEIQQYNITAFIIKYNKEVSQFK